MSIIQNIFGKPAPRRTRTGHQHQVLGQKRDEGDNLVDRRSLLSPMGWLFCLCWVFVAVVILDFGIMPLPYKLEEEAKADISARLDFSFHDPIWAQQQRERAGESAPVVFRQEERWYEQVFQEFDEIVNIVERSPTEDAGREDLEARKNLTADARDAQTPLFLVLWGEKKRSTRSTFLAGLTKDLKGHLRLLDRFPILRRGERQRLETRFGLRPIIRFWVATTPQGAHKLREENLRAEDIIEPRRAAEMLITDVKGKYIDRGAPLDRALLTVLSEYLVEHLGEALVYDDLETIAERKIAVASVRDVRPFERGRNLIEKGSLYTQDHLNIIRHEHIAFKKAQTLEENLLRWFGLGSLAAALIWLSALALRRVQRNALRRPRTLIAHALTCLAILVMAKVLMLNQVPSLLTPVAFATILASLVYSQPVALITASLLSILVGFAMGGDLSLTLALLVGSVVSALPGRELRHRWDLLRFGARGGFAQGLTVLGLSALVGTDLPHPVPQDALFGFANCIGCSLLLLGSLPLMEKAYGMVTNIRLFELSDPSQPALRKIQFEAGGTWAHTLQVGFLAVPAAEAIDANARLVQVGVYYHDLGKTLKPEYFIENNSNAEERHNRLAPSVSALIITGHVKDGMELAREFGLPRQIVDFIPEHHGTTLVSYFFHSAKRKAAEEQEEESVQEAFFQYPGPKPQSKETAIVMLADTVEAATRTLESPSVPHLRSFVHDLIMHKLLDGQLDECELTFRDLARIEDEFQRVLISRFHTRIKYPGQEGEGSANRRADKPGAPNRDSDSKLRAPRKDRTGEESQAGAREAGESKESSAEAADQDTTTAPSAKAVNSAQSSPSSSSSAAQ